MTDHEHDWWRTPSGALECACGESKRSTPVTVDTRSISELVGAALTRRFRNGGVHKHHKGCIHNMPPEEQIAMRGKSVEWWMTVVGSMPAQIAPEDWEEEPV